MKNHNHPRQSIQKECHTDAHDPAQSPVKFQHGIENIAKAASDGSTRREPEQKRKTEERPCNPVEKCRHGVALPAPLILIGEIITRTLTALTVRAIDWQRRITLSASVHVDSPVESVRVSSVTQKLRMHTPRATIPLGAINSHPDTATNPITLTSTVNRSTARQSLRSARDTCRP